MAESTLSVTLNGEPIRIPAGTRVADLVADLELQAGRFAVEVNRVIIPRSTHDAHCLVAGDAIEIVTFVGGG